MARHRGIIVDGVLLDEKQCRAVFGEVFAAARRGQRLKWWLFMAALVLVSVPIAIAVVWIVVRSFTFYVFGLAIAAVGGIVLGICIKHGFLLLFRREIRRALGEMGFRVCAGCGYWLKGLGRSNVCPECGEPAEPAEPEAEAR